MDSSGAMNAQQWRALDFVDIDKNLACCISIECSGLESLRGSTVMEQIDLRLVKHHENPRVEPEPLISEAAVLLIFGSIFDAYGCAMKHI